MMSAAATSLCMHIGILDLETCPLEAFIVIYL
jgi:hypothetical protein